MATVLVVEDALTDMQLLTVYLQYAGYSVVSATNSDEVQEKIEKNQPDVIFLDVILPGKSGFEICRELKTNPNTSKIPVVMCSTKNTDVDKMWGSMLGADAYICKPINQEDLLKTLMQFK
ncbi:two-component system response regulator [Scytonema hofmannii PCC 7110]|uniref:Two-component system response regulator n=1 Tax=Scytonema hofmannii PCC 7110 TaxID=128403 RepID=A0A139XCR2_9CYAN|nr:response regulator [Scytonema hofmannii]KYC42491.1 two-component system response regulator [Scytonema hofmannii PCC 7110]